MFAAVTVSGPSTVPYTATEDCQLVAVVCVTGQVAVTTDPSLVHATDVSQPTGNASRNTIISMAGSAGVQTELPIPYALSKGEVIFLCFSGKGTAVLSLLPNAAKK